MNSQDDYHFAIIGNGRTCALIDAHASIIFGCMPDFDSGTVFASLLDRQKGGSFGIRMVDGESVSQRYEANTGILVTTFRGERGAFEVIDFMPRYTNDERINNDIDVSSDIVRVLNPLSGEPQVVVDYDPRLEYGRFPTASFPFGKGRVKSTTSGDLTPGHTVYESCYLYSDLPEEVILRKSPFVLTKRKFLLLSYNDKVMEPSPDGVELMLQRTRAYWLVWAARTRKCDRYNEYILRSAITLKMLQFSPTGALIAAATTSLPETIGEERNWDYRFCWIRDGSMTADVLRRIGHPDMANRFIAWMLRTVPSKDDSLQIMYGIRGEKTLTEETLDHLDGYLGSRPVRIGNAAYHQRQHDIYGILMELIWQDLAQRNPEDHHVAPETLDRLWTRVRSIVKTVEEHWEKPDRGIWEIRGEERHFVFSKVLCWVAVDRAIRIAELLQKPEWAAGHAPLREKIHSDVLARGWNEKKQAFTQVYGGSDLDSANLLMAEYGFIDGLDPRFVSTVDRSDAELCRDGLMYRYRNKDDFGEPSSAFTVCSFWMVKALAISGRRAQARERFEKLLSYANLHGLYGEDLDFVTKRHLGNFPQAYSHLALINCALELAREADNPFIQV
ncbi:MAG: glycoside hydrolase family 15 protein [Luteolibacter sp.]